MDFSRLAHVHDGWIDFPGSDLPHDFSREEYELRLRRARDRMALAGLDALVITSSAVGQWFTSQREPHEWHDLCQSRSAWLILTPESDYLYMTPTAAGEHFNTTRRSTWVTHIRSIVERAEEPRVELWDVAQMPAIFADLGLATSRLGFELGDCMTLGINVSDFLRLRELMPHAELVDASPVIRWLMSVHTPEEIDRTRRACEAGVWIHSQVPEVLRAGRTEREFVGELADRFARRYGDGYAYAREGGWDVRNPSARDWNIFHSVLTDRPYRAGDLICRASSGASYRGYGGDLDRVWHLGKPSPDVLRWYRITWECNQAMAELIRPGARCSDVYAACALVEARRGLPERTAGRVGHGLRNTGGLSVHPDNHTVLEPGMIISVEAMFGEDHGFYDLEDQYVVTETGAERLHERAPEQMPVIRRELANVPHPIDDPAVYLERLSKPLIEKLRVADFLPPDAARVLDVGCSDGAVTAALAVRFPETAFLGIDLDAGFVERARNAHSDIANLTFERIYLRDLLARSTRYDAVVFCSVLHEFFTYGEGISSVVKALADAHELLAPGGRVVIRDMVLAAYARRSDLHCQAIVAKVRASEHAGRLSDFERAFGVADNLRAVNHFLLKYWYVENWERECAEDYVPVSAEQYGQVFDLLGMTVLHEESYLLDYLRGRWRQDFGLTERELGVLRSTAIIVARKG